MKTGHKKTGLILAGGDLAPAFAREIWERWGGEELFVIAADAGLEVCDAAGIEPDLILGDFDTVRGSLLAAYEGRAGISLERHNPVKDASDLELAVRRLRERGVRAAAALGALGGRADHSLANLRLCYAAARRDFQLSVLDPRNRIRCYAGEGERRVTISRGEQWGRYISVFPVGGEVQVLSLEGFRYPLRDFTLTERLSPTLTVSNELAAEEGVLRFRCEGGSGLIVMETGDRARSSDGEKGREIREE